MPRNRLRSLTAVLTASIVLALVAPMAAQETEQLCFLTVAKGFSSGHSERKNYVANSRVEWEDLWAKLAPGTNPTPELPEIDFTRRTIIAVFQGTKPSSGFEVAIMDVAKTENRVRVVVKETLNLHCSSTGGLTEPFHIVEVEKLDPVSVEFKLKQKVRKCS